MSGQADVPSRPLSNLQQRVVSAAVLAAAALALTFLGGLPFRLLAAAIAGAIFYEWSSIVRPRLGASLGLVPELLIAVFVVVLLIGPPPSILLAVTGTLVFAAFAAALWQRAGAWEPAGLAYAMLSGAALALIRGDDGRGLLAILFLFAVVWATDIFAYFVGRAVGGPKLAPSVSPGKTWSGALGGALGGVLAGLLLAGAGGAGTTLGLAAIAVVLSAVSQAGDLFESWVKRRNGVKDSGRLIPGHGGVMDRVDGLVAAALALLLIGWLSGSAEHPAYGLF